MGDEHMDKRMFSGRGWTFFFAVFKLAVAWWLHCWNRNGTKSRYFVENLLFSDVNETYSLYWSLWMGDRARKQ